MERYSEYKDSGVKWLGEIPSHWGLIKSKYLWKETVALSENGREELLSVSQYDGVSPSKSDSRSESLKGYKLVSENDLVINIMLAWLGGLGVSRYSGIVSPAYCTYKMVGASNPRFLHYLYKTPHYLAEFARHSTGVVPSRWRMYTDDFGQVLSLIPPRAEQDAIVSYLDAATSKIDAAIAQQQKMIDLLNERKQIIINNAVTKGLDPNVKMKPSGIDWIGDIPEHWEMKRWWFLMRENTQKNTNCKFRLQLQFRYGDIVRKSNQSEESDVLETISKYTIVQPNDIMINGLNLNYDFVSQRVAQVTESGVVTSAYICLRPTDIANSKYYTYLLKAMDAKKMFHGMGTGIRLTLSYNELKNQFIPYPSNREQAAIVSYLDAATSKIDVAIAQQQKMIELMNEYKQIIINDVVTGKVKVI